MGDGRGTGRRHGGRRWAVAVAVAALPLGLGACGLPPAATPVGAASTVASDSASMSATPTPLQASAPAGESTYAPALPPTYEPAPMQSTTRAEPGVAAPAASAADPSSCYPVSNSGTCYKAGEYCRKSDHGASGRTADGEAIVCEDNNGWRWEPA